MYTQIFFYRYHNKNVQKSNIFKIVYDLYIKIQKVNYNTKI